MEVGEMMKLHSLVLHPFIKQGTIGKHSNINLM